MGGMKAYLGRTLSALSLLLVAACGGGGGGGSTPFPTLTLLASFSKVVAPGATVTIEYVETDTTAAQTTIYADRDGDIGTTSDRIMIAARPTGDGSVQAVSWDTAGVASGDYFIIAMLEFGEAETLTAVAPEAITVNIPPTAELEAPPLATLAGAKIKLRYRDFDVDDEATTSLVLDRDGDASTTGDQILVVAGRAEQPGVTQEVEFDTAGIAEGDYTLFAVVDDGVHPPVAVPAPEPVRLGSTWLTVRDASGHGAANWPVTAIIPLERGGFLNTDRFRLEDETGNPVPAQFEVVNRWWHGDGSLRHVAAHFLATVPADGNARYRFCTHPAGGPAPTTPVAVTQDGNTITVDTGTVRFRVSKQAFNLFDEVSVDADGDGTYATGERIVAPGASDGSIFTGRLPGDVQRALDRADLTYEVEEAGPVRAVLRISAPTLFRDTDDHTHGFAVRIYAWAGTPFVKVDYQLQNSAKNARFAWPLYFEGLKLHVQTALDEPTVRMSPKPGTVWTGATGSYLFQSSLTDVANRSSADDALLEAATITAGESSFGWVDVADDTMGVAVMIRHMAEMWPNAVECAADDSVAIHLWPEWSAQWHEGEQSATGLYWLEDLQQVVKETLFLFHGAGVTNATLAAVAANHQYQPVAFVAATDYRRTMVTTDVLGLIPEAVALDTEPDTRRATYSSLQLDPTDIRYNFGWMNFGGNVYRKAASNAGGWPGSAAALFATERIDRFVRAERAMWGDLNVRPMWIAGYTHDADFALVTPTVNPYGGQTWRRFDGHGAPDMAADYLPGTAPVVKWDPRDNEHGWFYHLEEFYLATGNLWVRDWYEFMAEFRKRTLFRTGEPGDPFFEWGFETRGEGHMLANSVQAYRTVGGDQLLDALRQRLDWLRTERVDPVYGIVVPSFEASFQIGFLSRALLELHRELEDTDPEYSAKAFLLYWGMVEWNLHIGRYAYYLDSSIDNPPQQTSGSALTMIDPAAAFYLLTGRRDVLEDAMGYVESGYNGGSRPYGGFPEWTGGWEGRAYQYAVDHPKRDETPPPAVTDLTATNSGASVRLTWTAPTDAARYLVVWSTLPISRTFTKDAAKRNFWAGNAVGNTIEARPGEAETLEVTGLPLGPLYFAVVARDASGNLSAVSNIAQR